MQKLSKFCFNLTDSQCEHRVWPCTCQICVLVHHTFSPGRTQRSMRLHSWSYPATPSDLGAEVSTSDITLHVPIASSVFLQQNLESVNLFMNSLVHRSPRDGTCMLQAPRRGKYCNREQSKHVRIIVLGAIIACTYSSDNQAPQLH
jgi:hypothetical protein